jgi:hypothetical protein
MWWSVEERVMVEVRSREGQRPGSEGERAGDGGVIGQRRGAARLTSPPSTALSEGNPYRGRLNLDAPGKADRCDGKNWSKRETARRCSLLGDRIVGRTLQAGRHSRPPLRLQRYAGRRVVGLGRGPASGALRLTMQQRASDAGEAGPSGSLKGPRRTAAAFRLNAGPTWMAAPPSADCRKTNET